MTRVAEVHQTTLTPTKLELLQVWLPQQAWWPGGPAEAAVEKLGTYRLVDPQGEVGIETFVLRTGETLVQVPLTYRNEPLEGAALVGTLEHGVLGTRYVHDGTTDPVAVGELVRTILAGDREAEVSSGRELDMHVRGSGTLTDAVVDVVALESLDPSLGEVRAQVLVDGATVTYDVVVPRVVDEPVAGDLALVGSLTAASDSTSYTLAVLREVSGD